MVQPVLLAFERGTMNCEYYGVPPTDNDLGPTSDLPSMNGVKLEQSARAALVKDCLVHELPNKL